MPTDKKKILDYLKSRDLLTDEQVEEINSHDTSSLEQKEKNAIEIVSFLEDDPDHSTGAGSSQRFGKYVRLERIGSGGSGTVFRAYDPELKRFVAIKTLNIPDEASLKRFRKEAHTLAKLSHPHIVPVHETGEANGVNYMAMQYIEGTTLDDAATHLTREELIKVLIKVCEALEYAHNKGVIHRDLKPSNILIDTKNNVYVVDFEISTELDSLQTRTGEIAGTPAYMSPEQIEKKRADERTDIYSLGATMYLCLTGCAPFESAGLMETIRKVIEEDPAPPSQLDRTIDRELDIIITKCMNKSPASRYQTAAALKDDLQRYVTGLPLTGKGNSAGYKIRREIKKQGYLFGFVALLTIISISIYMATIGEKTADTSLKNREAANPYYEKGMALLNSVIGMHEIKGNPDLNGMLKQAITEFTTAIEKDRLFVNAYLKRGEAHFRLDNYKEAIDDSTRAINILPTLADAYYLRVISTNAYMSRSATALFPITRSLYFNNDIESIEKDVNKLIELNSVPAKIHFLKALLIFLKSEEQGEWEKELITASEIDPSLPDPYFFRSMTYTRASNHVKDPDEERKIVLKAFNLFRKGFKSDPNHHIANSAFVTCCIKLERYGKALEAIKRMKLIQPADINISIYLAQIYLDQGEKEKAIAEIESTLGKEHTIKYETDAITFYFNRGTAYLRLDQQQKAYNDFNVVEDIFPEQAREWLKNKVEAVKTAVENRTKKSD